MTTTYEIEHDYSWDQLNTAHTPNRAPTRSGTEKGNTQHLADEYQFLRTQGLTNHTIATRLGTNWDALQTRLNRAGITIDTRTRAVRRQQTILDRLIKTGQPFTSDHLPAGGEDESINFRLLGQAARAKRIVQAGKAKSSDGSKITVWQGVPASAVAA